MKIYVSDKVKSTINTEYAVVLDYYDINGISCRKLVTLESLDKEIEQTKNDVLSLTNMVSFLCSEDE